MITLIVGVVALIAGFVVGIIYSSKAKALLAKELADVKAAAAKGVAKL